MTFTEILDLYSVKYLTEGDRHCRPGWVQMDCPFCGRDTGKMHMGYNVEKRYVNCYKCRGHSLLSTLIEQTRERSDVLRKLLDGIDSEYFELPKSKRGKLTLPKPLGELTAAHKDYLRGRGYNVRELQEMWSIQGLGQTGHVKTPEGQRINLNWRVFLPFLNARGELVSWNTRAIRDDVERRYISAPESCEVQDGKELLYGERYCAHACCVVEGPFDVWAGGPGFVGTNGTSFKRAQVLRLSRYIKRGICYDADAQAQARELRDMLEPFPGDTFLFQLDSKDPSEDMKRGGKDIRLIRKELGL